jgi:hypothetical protein
LYETKGEEFLIHDATSRIPFQEFIINFVDKLLATNKDFKGARKWLGS